MVIIPIIVLTLQELRQSIDWVAKIVMAMVILILHRVGV